MNRVQGFELVEQFLDNWKKEAFEWYMDQDVKYQEAKKNRKENPSEADILYHNWDAEKVNKFLESKFEKHPEQADMWKVPSRYYCRGYEKFEYVGSYNAIVRIMNDEYQLFCEAWEHVRKIYDHVGGKYKSYAEYVEVMLQKEYERKYEKLASDCYKITGAIQKADLRINHSSKNIEGFIHGEIGNAELWSTLSGGEVQCLHLRFYCHKR